MDSLLMQYELLNEDGEIDEDLFEIGSIGKGYQGVQSFNEKKFCYFESDRIIELSNLIFSNQSLLASDKKANASDAFHLRVIEGVSKEDFNEYQLPYIDRLITEGVLGLNIAGQIYFKDETLMLTLYYIWSSGYLNLLYCPDIVLEIVQRLYEAGDVRYGGTLFSEQEIKMISFYMDDKTFGNSHAIRNKITHGRMARKDAGEIKSYYLRLLMILLLYTIRITEELDNIGRDTDIDI